MAQDLIVPKFGTWDDGGNVQYTAYFERARKGNSGITGVLTNSQSNSEVDVRSKSHTKGRYLRKKVDQGAHRGLEAAVSQHDHRRNREGVRKLMHPPLHPVAIGRIAGRGPSQQHNVALCNGSTWWSTQTKHNQCPRRQHHHGGVTGRTSSPSRKKGYHSSDVSNYNMAIVSPGRSRPKSIARGEEAPNHGVAVPKFGDWDERNPSAGEKYSEIFNRVIDQKKSGPGTVQTTSCKSLHSPRTDVHGYRSSMDIKAFKPVSDKQRLIHQLNVKFKLETRSPAF